MSGAWNYLGGFSVGALVPGVMPMYTAIVGDLQAQLAGALQLYAQLKVHPPTLVANLQMALKLVAALQAAIAIGAPSIDFSVSAAALLIIKIRAQLAILLGLPFATAGVHAYSYDGDPASAGAALTTEIGGGLPGGTPRDHCNGVLYITSVGAAWTAMGAVLKVG